MAESDIQAIINALRFANRTDQLKIVNEAAWALEKMLEAGTLMTVEQLMASERAVMALIGRGPARLGVTTNFPNIRTHVLAKISVGAVEHVLILNAHGDPQNDDSGWFALMQKRLINVLSTIECDLETRPK